MSLGSSSQGSNFNNVPSFESRRTFLKGSPPFIWDTEQLRSDQPYADGKYKLAHNPPPNEVNFVGGIGSKFGRTRSKVHPSRPTTLQQIYGMRTRNKIVHTFSQPVKDTFCSATKQKSSKQSENKQIEAIVKHCISVDMVTSATSSDSSSSVVSRNAFPRRKPSTQHSPEAEDGDLFIDGKPFYHNEDSIKANAREFIDRIKQDDEIIVDRLPLRDEDHFRAWALRERAKFQGKASEKENSGEVESTDSYVTDIASHKKSRFNSKNVIHHITGYMHGPFTKPPSPDGQMQKTNKFGIPTSMLDRAKRFEKNQTIRDGVLRRARLDNLGFKQPPDKEDSSDDNESVMNVKKLALIRTPYFTVPTVRIDKVKRTKQFRNKYLRNDRLKRINLLLRDEKYNNLEKSNSSVDAEQQRLATNRRKQSVVAKFMQLMARNKTRPDDRDRDPEKEKYYKLINTKFIESRNKCEPLATAHNKITFGQFKNFPGLADLKSLVAGDPSGGVPNIEDEGTNAASGPDDPDRAKSLRSRFAKSQPRKLFQRSRNERLSRMDELLGPFYIDPNLMDKFRSPKKFKCLQKYYTNLIKGKYWIRDRMQVNAPEFAEEKIGVGKDKYFSRLATEWDEYYIHELRHRPRIRKFCVKTDIATIREITRNSYIMYSIQENLLNMQQVRKEESRRLNEVEKFQEICFGQFDKWKKDTFDKVVKAHEQLKDIQKNISELRNILTVRNEMLDQLNLKIFEMEQRWNFLMRLQNYYYLVQSENWRLTNDWIHLDDHGKLQPTLEAYKFCGIRNIRQSLDSSGFSVKTFFEAEIEKNLDRMRKVEPQSDILETNLWKMNSKAMDELTQHNFTFWTYKGVFGMCNRLLSQIDDVNQRKNDQIKILSKKNQFLVQSGYELRLQALKAIDQELPLSVECKIERKILAIAALMHASFVERTSDNPDAPLCPANITHFERFKQIHEFVLDIFHQMDAIPLDVLRVGEKFMRAQRRMRQHQTAEALVKQQRYDLMRRQIENHFSATAQFRRVKILSHLDSKQKDRNTSKGTENCLK